MTATAGVGDYEWWKYVIMPFMSGIVGWFTNVLALEMTFRPIEYFGISLFRLEEQPWGLFGWQGIIPTKARKMATICVTLMTERLFDIQDIFKRLDPDKFYEAMDDRLLLMIDNIITEVAEKYMPGTWSILPKNVKNEMVIMANKACPEFINDFLSDMQANVHNVLDIKEMAVSACVANKGLVNKIFQECGSKEFAFIRLSGLYFGFLFGCIQMGIWFLYDGSWLLPICGFIVGWLTNYLALKVIFRPLNPVKCGPITIHGIFLKRQDEVSETFSRVNCNELLTTERMWESILEGPKRKNFQVLLRAHSIVFTDKLIGGLKPIALRTMGMDQFAMMKEDVAAKVITMLPDIIDLSYDYTTTALDLERTICEKMKALTAEEFEGVLHPAFEEDEMTLIFIGGVLGMLVGIIQMFLIF